MFGIKSLIIKLVLIMAGAVVIICVATTAGCGTANGALAMKTTSKASNDSMNFGDGFVVDPVELMRVRAEEKKMLVDATEMKYRILAIGLVIGGICAFFIAWWNRRALLKKSPLDDYRRDGI